MEIIIFTTICLFAVLGAIIAFFMNASAENAIRHREQSDITVQELSAEVEALKVKRDRLLREVQTMKTRGNN